MIKKKQAPKATLSYQFSNVLTASVDAISYVVPNGTAHFARYFASQVIKEMLAHGRTNGVASYLGGSITRAACCSLYPAIALEIISFFATNKAISGISNHLSSNSEKGSGKYKLALTATSTAVGLASVAIMATYFSPAAFGYMVLGKAGGYAAAYGIEYIRSKFTTASSSPEPTMLGTINEAISYGGVDWAVSDAHRYTKALVGTKLLDLGYTNKIATAGIGFTERAMDTLGFNWVFDGIVQKLGFLKSSIALFAFNYRTDLYNLATGNLNDTLKEKFVESLKIYAAATAGFVIGYIRFFGPRGNKKPALATSVSTNSLQSSNSGSSLASAASIASSPAQEKKLRNGFVAVAATRVGGMRRR